MCTRLFVASDEAAVRSVFRRAFAGFPWFNACSEEETERVWRDHASRPGFGCLVGVESDRVVAATWHDTPSEDDLLRERGRELTDFAREQGVRGPIVWMRETVCDPDFQGRGLTGQLKEASVDHLRADYPGALLLTRMRDDNVGIVRVNQRLGFRKTGVRVDSKTIPGLVHDYWFLRA